MFSKAWYTDMSSCGGVEDDKKRSGNEKRGHPYNYPLPVLR